MQMRGNLHRYRVSSSGTRNRMVQGTFIPSYRAVLKFAAYGLLYTLLKGPYGRKRFRILIPYAWIFTPCIYNELLQYRVLTSTFNNMLSR